MKTRRRDIEIFSLSFLDCICCGFGAIILLFVLSKFAEPLVIDEIKKDMRAEIIRLEKEVFEIRGETSILNRELTAKKEQLSKEKEKVARLQDDLSDIEGQYAASKSDAQVQNIIDGKLARARQELTAESSACKSDRFSGGHSGGQRVHRFYHRHLGQHAAQCLEPGAAKNAGDSRCLSASQRHPGNERYGKLPVFPVCREMDT